jgi:hypothetical protein
VARSNQTFVRQSRVRVRSALRGAAFTGVIAVVATWFGWFPKLAWGVVAFFLVIAALEFVAMRANQRDDRK